MAGLEYLFIAAFLLLGIICIVSNFLVCCIVVRCRREIGAFGYFAFSLAVADMLVGAVNVPLYLTLQFTLPASELANTIKNDSTSSANHSMKWTNYAMNVASHSINSTKCLINSTSHSINETKLTILCNHPINYTQHTINLKNLSIKSSNHSLDSTSHSINDLSPFRKGIYISLNVLEVYLSSCSIFHLCLMALDRVILVTRPIYHRAEFPHGSLVIKLTCMPWLLAIILSTISLISNVSPGTISNVVLILATLIFIPFAFIVICYVIIFVNIRRRNQQFSRGTSTIPGTHLVKKVDETRMIKMVLCIVLVFLICWLPLVVINYIFPEYKTVNGFGTEWKTRLGTIAKLFHYSNSACNPFIYFFLSPTFKSGMKVLFKNCLSRQRESNDNQLSRTSN